MARTLTRPMFRKGGMAQREEYMGGGIKTIRPKYMGGGMTGIMSGIVPDAGLTPRVGYAEGPSLQEIIAREKLQDPSTIIYDKDYIQKLLDQKTRKLYDPGLLSYGQQIETPDTPTQRAIKKYLEENPEGAYEAFKEGEIPGFGDTNYGALQAAQAKEAKEAGIDLNLGETKIDTSDAINTNDSLNIEGGEKDIKDEETALMKAYKEYAPIFEKELGVSDEDTKKSLYMNLAKFGAGILAQPGGDLVGAIGKAAEKPLEGASATLKEKTDAKRQAKLLALQTAISEGKPGTIGKAIKDIAKVYKVSEEEAAKIYEKWNQNTSTAQAADTKAYRDFAKEKNVNPEGFTRNIKKLLSGDDADLVGKFNKKLPLDDGVPDVDEIVDKEYYIGEGGELYRADKSTDPPTLLEPGDPGFKDSKKEK